MAYGTVGGHWASEQGIQTKRLVDGRGREQHLGNIKRELDGVLETKGIDEVHMQITLRECRGELTFIEAFKLANLYK
jgi:hypothetical protein